ncbi:hypothetical protein RRG08_016457 [Elysia crispata]|uniref:Uncharacterized protein n=1 Tax=Elysia crispata TaxID=231223 RepID=A0AAE1CUL1_9GAST|nr:hypothetical protein RRG08_016457 [Elysia crispata]
MTLDSVAKISLKCRVRMGSGAGLFRDRNIDKTKRVFDSRVLLQHTGSDPKTRRDIINLRLPFDPQNTRRAAVTSRTRLDNTRVKSSGATPASTAMTIRSERRLLRPEPDVPSLRESPGVFRRFRQDHLKCNASLLFCALQNIADGIRRGFHQHMPTTSADFDGTSVRRSYVMITRWQDLYGDINYRSCNLPSPVRLMVFAGPGLTASVSCRSGRLPRILLRLWAGRTRLAFYSLYIIIACVPPLSGSGLIHEKNFHMGRPVGQSRAPLVSVLGGASAAKRKYMYMYAMLILRAGERTPGLKESSTVNLRADNSTKPQQVDRVYG